VDALVFCEGISFAHIARAALAAQALQQRGLETLLIGPTRSQAAAQRCGVAWQSFTSGSMADPELVFARFAAGHPAYTAAEVSAALDHDRAAIAHHRPRLVVGDFRPTAWWAAREAGVPSLALTEAPCHPHFQAPTTVPQPFCRPRWLPVSWLDRLGGTGVGRHLARRGWAAAVEPFRRAARSAGLPDPGTWGELHTGADAVALTDHPLLWPELRLRPRELWTGAMIWKGDGEAPPLPDDGRPLVYLALGTQSAMDPAFVPKLLDLLLAAGLRVLCSQGGRELAVALPQHPHLHCLRFVDEARILPQAAVAVHPGGAMTCWNALWHGCPQVHLPAHAQQQFYACALAERGLGAWARPALTAPRALADMIIGVAGDERIRQACHQASAILRQPGPDVWEALLARLELLPSVAS
jgi:sterol 3beta-glucosyltransferase